MVKVKFHRKLFLKDLFEYGPSYSAIMYPKGQESQVGFFSRLNTPPPPSLPLQYINLLVILLGVGISKPVLSRIQAKTVSDDDDEDGQVEFTSLPLWQEYCVYVKVEMISDDVSNTSLPRCIYPSAGTHLNK